MPFLAINFFSKYVYPVYKLPPVAAMIYVAPLFGCSIPNMAQYYVVTNALKDVSL